MKKPSFEDAILSDDLNELEKVLKAGGDVNDMYNDYKPILMFAVDETKINAIRFLVANGLI